MNQVLLAAIHRLPTATSKIIRTIVEQNLLENWPNWAINDFVSAGIDQTRTQAFIDSLKNVSFVETEKILTALNISVLTQSDSLYPPFLSVIPSPPPILYVRGPTQFLSQPMLAVVGTRRPSDYGLAVTNYLVKPIARTGIPIISGLAYGIDAAAHRATLDVQGKTVAVFGTGIDKIYPAAHHQLAQSILDQDGALVSEFPLGAGPEKHHFPQRNRIISGLSRAVLLVEAPSRSGALVTAKFAVDQNRDVYVVPGDIFRDTAIGPLNWLKLGATPIISPEDILSCFPGLSPSIPPAIFIPPTTDQNELAVIAVLGPTESKHIDEIIEESKLGASVVIAILALLEIRGLIRHHGGMRYTIVA